MNAALTAQSTLRLRRPTWKDPRLVAGLIFIAISVVTGAWAVNTAADTTEVYALTRDIAPGTDLSEEGLLTIVEAHPGTASGTYLSRGQLTDDAVATRSLSKGELLPAAAVGSAGDVAMRRIVIDVGASLPSNLGPGSDVDLWRLPAASVSGGESKVEPEDVASGLVVASLVEDDGSLISSASVSVEVLVPPDELAAVLKAVGSDDRLVLVPTGSQA